MRKNLSLFLVLALFMSMSCLSFAESSMLVNNESQNKNPYVQEYLQEKSKETKSKIQTLSSEQLVADPVEEEKIIISTLEEYYKKDLEVAEILKNYFEESICIKILSPNKQDKTDTMLKIKDIYYSINDAEQSVLKDFISRYVTASDNSTLKEFYSQIKSNFNSLEVSSNKIRSSQLNSVTNTTSYTGYAGLYAANWAYDNYSNTSTANYPYFDSSIYGSDCANFVSQAMHEGGGMPMMGNWYCYKKNSSYPIPANATQLNYSWNLSDPSPWISVSSLRGFLEGISPMALSFPYTKDEYVANHEDIYNIDSITLGDVVLLCKGISWVQLPTHAMIISRFDSINRDFLLAGHSNPRQAYPLLTAIDSYAGIIIYRLN